MMKKIWQKIKEIICQHYRYFILFFVLLFTLTFEFPYYIDAPGGTIDIASRIQIDGKPTSNKHLYMAYVSELKATIPTLLLSKIKKDWDVIPKNQVVLTNEVDDDVYFRDRLALEEANQNAILVAFKKANQKVKITSKMTYVTYIDPIASTDLKVGDEIKQVNGIAITSKEEMNAILHDIPVDDSISISVKRNQKEVLCYAFMKPYEGGKAIGIMATEKRELETDPKVTFSFKASESGPSGGFMMTLALYSALMDIDLTNGKKVVGTGTIEEDGIIGRIDGIKYKLKGAVKNKADIFFAPADTNYKEALKEKEKNLYDITIVKVNTIDDAISYLKKNP